MVKQKTMAQIPALLLSGTVGVLMAYNGMSYWGIATQTLTFITVVNLSFWYFSPWRPTFHINFRPLKSMFGFSSKILVTNIFTQANNNILSTLLGRFSSEQEVGYYTQSNKWNTMGYSFISGTVSSVAQPVLTEVSNDPARPVGRPAENAPFYRIPILSGHVGTGIHSPRIYRYHHYGKMASLCPYAANALYLGGIHAHHHPVFQSGHQ